MKKMIQIQNCFEQKRGLLIMIHKLILAFASCLLASSAFVGETLAQDETLTFVKGKVVDQETKRPIYGAVVRIEYSGEARYGSTTESDGTFSVAVSDERDAGRLVVSLVGYHDFASDLNGMRDGASLFLVELKSNPIGLPPTEIIGESDVVNQRRTGTVSKLRGDVVELLKPIGTQELLEMVPGVNGFADDGIGNSRLSIGIRGLNPRRSSRVLILEDGIPIQPAVYTYPNVYYNPPAERISAMEVVKSSSSIRFGPQTMGGVINYITRRPDGKNTWSSQITGGSNGYFSAFIEKRGIGGSEKTTDIQALYKRGDGFRDNNAFMQLNGTVKSQFQLSDKRIVYLKANVNFEDSDATYTGLTEYSFQNSPSFNPKKYDNFKVFRASLDMIYTNQISANLVGNTKAYMNVFDRKWWRENDIFANLDGEAANSLEMLKGEFVRTGGGENNLGILRNFYVGGLEQGYTLKHSFMGKLAQAEFGVRAHWERFIDDKKQGNRPNSRSGVYYTGVPVEERVDPTAEYEKLNLFQSHHYETAALALFAKESVRLGQLTVDPGLRFEVFRQGRVDRLQGSMFLDKVSAVLLPGLGANLKAGQYNFFAGIHRGYTPPSSGTLKVTGFGGNVDAGGLDLRSEKSWNVEAGIRSWQSNRSLEAAVFMINIEDLVAAGRGTAFNNLGKANTRGVEVGLSYNFSSLLSLMPELHLSYTYLETEITSGIVASQLKSGRILVSLKGKELPYAPRHTLVVGLSKETNFGLRIRGDLKYVDEVYTDFENSTRTNPRGNEGPVPAYSVANLSAEYGLFSDWNLFFAAKNVLDEVYIGSRLHSAPGQDEPYLSSGILVGPRRQINVGIKGNF